MSCSARHDWPAFLESPDRLDEIDVEAIPDMLGALETLKTRLLVRLYASHQRNAGALGTVEERLLTMAEVADALGVEQDYAYELGRRGEIATIRFGKYVRVRADDLRAFMDDHRQDGLDSGKFSSYKKSHTSRRPRDGQ